MNKPKFIPSQLPDDHPLSVFLDGLDKGFGPEAIRAAQLLEAAPDLLAALRALQLSCALAAAMGEPVPPDDPANLAARAAIAKAETEE